MTRALGQRTVVEGVETAEQASALLSLGCDAVQGFLYSRPLPADELLRTLTRGRPPWMSGMTTTPP
jgi:EAL domain-containing protein (putative c-di-GMP-specific phosphodiesterase class I)